MHPSTYYQLIYNDPKVIYLLEILRDLYPGEWECEPEGSDGKFQSLRRVVIFLREGCQWLGLNLDSDYIIGVGCPTCQHSTWGEWEEFDFTNDSLVRSQVKDLVGYGCKCVYSQFCDSLNRDTKSS